MVGVGISISGLMVILRKASRSTLQKPYGQRGRSIKQPTIALSGRLGVPLWVCLFALS